MKSASVKLVMQTCLKGHSFGVPEDDVREMLCPICNAELRRDAPQSSKQFMLAPGTAILSAIGIFLAMGALLKGIPAGIYMLLVVAACMIFYLNRARRQSAQRPPSTSRAALEKTIQFFQMACAICLMLSIVQFWINHSAEPLDEKSTKAQLLAVREQIASWHGFLIDSKLALIITCVLLLVMYLTYRCAPPVRRFVSEVFANFMRLTDNLVHAFIVVSMFGVGVTYVDSALMQGIADVESRSAAVDEVYYRVGDAVERELMQQIAKGFDQERPLSCMDGADDADGACTTLQELVNEQVTLLGKLDTIFRFEGRLETTFRDDFVRATKRFHNASDSSRQHGTSRPARAGAPDTVSISSAQDFETILKEGQANASPHGVADSSDEIFVEAVSESLKVAGEGNLKKLLEPFIAASPFFEVLLHLADETLIAAVRTKAADILLRVSKDPRLDLRAQIDAGAAAISRSKVFQRVRESMVRSGRELNKETRELISAREVFAYPLSLNDGLMPLPRGADPERHIASRDTLVRCLCVHKETGEVKKVVTLSSSCIPVTTRQPTDARSTPQSSRNDLATDASGPLSSAKTRKVRPRIAH